MSILRYRPDIDGLRAIAILSVLIFHAFPQYLPGGFVGVDIFFVISGYLITTIILSSLQNDTFTFGDFYKRRVLRIFPALLLVLTFVSLIAWLYFLPSEFRNYSKHLFSSTLFASNITLFNEVGYFDSKAEVKPLLHFWSLGIEEQFYIFWPVILIFTFRKKKDFLISALLIFLISFTVNRLRVRSHPEEIFFLLHGRFWELLIGGILAWYLNFTESFRISSRVRNSVSLFGLILILFSLIYLSKKNSFPGSWALAPTLGAAFLILAGPNAWLNKNILSRKVLVYIGLISYPLYLWHWPLLSFLYIFKVQFSFLNVISALILTLLLAVLTFELVEKPLRKISLENKTRLTFSLAGLTMIIMFTGLAGYIGILKVNHSDEVFEKISEATEDWMFPKNLEPHKLDGFPPYRRMGTGETKILLVGDSHMQMYLPYFVKNADFKKNTLIFVTEGGCPAIPDTRDLRPEKKVCPKLFQLATHIAGDPGVKKVVLASAWVEYFSKGTQYYYKNSDNLLSPGAKGYQKAIHELGSWISKLSKEKKVYFISNVPLGPEFDPRQMINRKLPSPEIVIKTNKFELQRFIDKNSVILEDLKMISGMAGAKYLDPIPYLCENSQCPVVTADMKPVYKDSGHIRPFFIIEKGEFLKPILE